MRGFIVACAIAAGGCVNISGVRDEADTREHINSCTVTVVRSVGGRAGDSGSAIAYENGQWQVDYETIAGIRNSRVGDQVLLCLIEIPESCPPGDDRGRLYHGVNLRTHESWNALNSEHYCGGA